ncbi:hypothetical protein MSG66_17725 [Acinetobacter sp. IK31]|uniref:hypothetical protein n=1 Tax=Acinetobacter sp. IK31 TaxID=2928895 RepID=UPI002D20B2B5|nr:hypothetical protein [Acinetobacter sp. IK31]MEB3865842.1 hypothetical protein [Acinetobacter sp. IK31]
MLETVNSISANCPMPLSEALKMPLSFESIYFNSSAWESRKKYLENEVERHNAFIKLGQEVIKGLNVLASRGR